MATAIGTLLLAGFMAQEPPAGAGESAAGASAAADVAWRTDLDAALGEAKQQHRPLFVVFRCER